MISSIQKTVLFVLILTGLILFPNSLDAEQEYELIQDLSIGIDVGDENLMFGSIINISLDGDQNIYVLDRKNFQIKKFDPQGNFIFMLPIERGQGPKEATGPSTIAVTPSGMIFLLDFSAKKIIVFKETGEFHNSIQLAFQLTYCVPYGDEEVAVIGLKADKLIHIYDASGKHLNSFGGPYDVPSKLSQYKDMPLLKAPMRFSGAEGSRLFVLNPHKYEITRYKNGEVARVIQGKNKSFLPLKTSSPDKKRFSILFPTINAFEHKELLYVWIRAMPGVSSNQLDIFSNYQPIASLDVSGEAWAVDNQGRIYFAEVDDYPKVIRYRIILKN